MSPKIKFREMIRQRLPKGKADVTGQAIKIERKWLEESLSKSYEHEDHPDHTHLSFDILIRIGTLDIDSTPPPIDISAWPDITCAAAIFVASNPEAQNLST